MPKTSKSLDEFNAIATEFAGLLEAHWRGATIVTLSGVLGAGKTTFVKAVAHAMGIEEDVTSPTFVIERIYQFAQKTKGYERFIHYDAYRMEKSDELEALGWKQLINDEKNLIFVEWPEKIFPALSFNNWKVKIDIKEGDVREITYVEDK